MIWTSTSWGWRGLQWSARGCQQNQIRPRERPGCAGRKTWRLWSSRLRRTLKKIVKKNWHSPHPMHPADIVASIASAAVIICVADDTVLELLPPSLPTALALICGDSTNLSSAVTREPYFCRNSMIMPLVHPKPNCTSYSPPLPCPPGTVASYYMMGQFLVILFD